MPRATISAEATRHELKALPDGFVEIKRMSYGEWLHRTDISMNVRMEMQGKTQGGSIDLANRRVAGYEFSKCIVSHNLEDEAGNPLNFADMGTLDRLDPQVGNEIGELIRTLHEVDEGNSPAN